MASEFMTPGGKLYGIRDAAVPKKGEVKEVKNDYGGKSKQASSKTHVNFKSGGSKRR